MSLTWTMPSGRRQQAEDEHDGAALCLHAARHSAARGGINAAI